MIVSSIETQTPLTQTPPEAPAPSSIRDWFIALRPRQWAKNLMVFAGMIFAGKAIHLSTMLTVTGGFAIFCVFSSVGYLINDVLDREKDRAHPVKCHRPIAAGRISPRHGDHAGRHHRTGRLCRLLAAVARLHLGLAGLPGGIAHLFALLETSSHSRPDGHSRLFPAARAGGHHAAGSPALRHGCLSACRCWRCWWPSANAGMSSPCWWTAARRIARCSPTTAGSSSIRR